MKTLKKTLCLILALAMVLSFGAMSASAKLTYTDKADIQVAEANNDMFAEAIDTLGLIGVMEGYPDGSFLPTKAVTRAEAAKVIAYLAIGDADRADALVAPADPFDDVSKDHWAAGYIAYCVQIGVINGMGDGTFAPDAEVTGLQFAKMLLCVLGYGANGEYKDTNWAINAAKDGLTYGLFDDYEQGASNVAATREEIALYAFNALFLYKVSYSALLGDYINMIEPMYRENGGRYYGWYIGNAGDGNMQGTLAEDFDLIFVNGWLEGETDEFMRDKGHRWGIKDGKKFVYTDWYDADAFLVATFTTKVTGNDLYEVLTKDGRKAVAEVKYANATAASGLYIDGLNYNLKIDASKGEKAELKVTEKNVTGNGVETYVYEYPDVNGETTVKICVVNTYPATVKKAVAETKTKDAYALVEIGFESAITGITNREQYPSEKKDTKVQIDTDKLAKNDEILVQYSLKDGKVVSYYAPTVENGKMTKYKNNKATIGGVDYAKAFADEAKTWDKDTFTNAADVDSDKTGKTYDVYTDQYGYMVGIKGAKAAGTKLVYAADFGYKTKDTELGEEVYATAKVYYTDGTSEVVTVSMENWAWLAGLFFCDHGILELLDDVTGILTTDEKLAILDSIFGDDSDAVDPGMTWGGFGLVFLDNVIGSWIVNFEDRFYDITPTVVSALMPYGLYTIEMNDDDEAELTPVHWAADDEDEQGLFYGEWRGGKYHEISTKVVNGIAALRPVAGEAVYADDDTAFFYVTNPDKYGVKDGGFELTVYTGIDNVPTISQKTIEDSLDNPNLGHGWNGFMWTSTYYGLNSLYAEDNYALAAVCFIDDARKGETVYFFDYDAKNTYIDNENDTWDLVYTDLYLDCEAVDAKVYSYAKKNDAKAALTEFVDELDSTYKMGWVVEDKDNYTEICGDDGMYYDDGILYLDATDIYNVVNAKNLYLKEDWKYNMMQTYLGDWNLTNDGLFAKNAKVVDLVDNDNFTIEDMEDLQDLFDKKYYSDVDGSDVQLDAIKAYLAVDVDTYSVLNIYVCGVEFDSEDDTID